MDTKSTAELQINRKHFIEALAQLAPLTGGTGPATITYNVRAHVAGGDLHLSATDFETALQVALPCAPRGMSPVEGTCPGAFLIPAKETLKALRGWSGETLTIRVANMLVSFEEPGAAISLPSADAGLFPKLDLEKYQRRFGIPAAVLSRALSCTLPFVQTSEARKNLMGVHVKVDQKAVRWEASNGHILGQLDTRPKIHGGKAAGDCIIPASAIRVLLPLIKKMGGWAEVSWEHPRYRIDLGDVVLSGLLVDGTFPKLDQVIPEPSAHPCTVDPAALASAVKSASANISEVVKIVALRLEKDRIIVGTEPSPQGQAVQVRAALYDGPSLQIGFNATYLLSMLKEAQGGAIDIHITEALKATRWQFFGEKFVGVVMPYPVEYEVPDAPAPATPPAPVKKAERPKPAPAPKPTPASAAEPVAVPPVEPPPLPPNVVPFGRIGADRLAVIDRARTRAAAAHTAPLPTMREAAPKATAPEARAVEPKAPAKPKASQGPGQRAQRKTGLPMTPERRTAIALKAAQTRRDNLAAKAG